MSSPRFAALRAGGRAELPQHARTSAPPATEDETEDPENEENEMAETIEENALDETAIRADERAKSNARVAAVFASEDVKGREAAAARLLATTDMGADAIVALLPDLKPAASGEDDGERMLNLLENEQNADLGAGNGDNDKNVDHSAGWAKAVEKLNTRNGF